MQFAGRVTELCGDCMGCLAWVTLGCQPRLPKASRNFRTETPRLVKGSKGRVLGSVVGVECPGYPVTHRSVGTGLLRARHGADRKRLHG